MNLIGARTGRVFLHAVLFTQLERLAPGAKDDLLAADIPIGRILLRHRMETRRELSEVGVVRAGRVLGRTFQLPEDAPVLCRRYTVIHGEKPLISIEERIPAALWSDGATVLSRASEVVVQAPARLHLGMIDLHGGLGRVGEGIGITFRATTLRSRRNVPMS